jgi:hypothetical protein
MSTGQAMAAETRKGSMNFMMKMNLSEKSLA